MSLTGKTKAGSYKDILQMNNSNSGVDGSLRSVADGEWTASSLLISTNHVAIAPQSADSTGVIKVSDKDGNENNFGLGSTVYGDVVETVPLTSPNIAWDDTNKVFSISKSGIYEVVCDAKITINGSQATVLSVYINTAADTLGTKVHTETFEVDSGDDPVPATIRWMGKIANGEHIAVTIDAGGRYPMFETGSTLRILRIAWV